MCTSSTRPCARCARTSPGPAAISGWCRIRRPGRRGVRGLVSGDGEPVANPELGLRDAAYVGRWLPFVRLAVKGWHRSEVHGIENIPDGGALLVSNHSGGITTMDVPVLALAFFDHFGLERPLYVLTHDLMLMGPMGTWMRKAGLVSASRRNAADILRSGAVTIVFPGGDHDAYRPTRQSAVIDFAGRTGYVRSAARGRRADRAGGEHRWPGEPALPRPRRAPRPTLRPAGAGALEVLAGEPRLPVRREHGLPAQPAVARRRS